MTTPNREDENVIHPEESEVIPPPRDLQSRDTYTPQSQYPRNGGDANNDWMKPVIASVVVVLLALGGLYFANVFVQNSKFVEYSEEVLSVLNGFDESIQAMETELNATLDTVPTTITSKINEGINDIESDISNLRNQVQTAVSEANSVGNDYSNLNSSLNNIQSKINSLESSVSSLNSEISTVVTESDIDALVQTLKNLQARIEDIEESMPSGDGGDTTSGELTATIKQQTDYLLVSGNESVGVLRITIENNTDKDMEDIILGIGFRLPYTVSVDSLTISGGLQGWMPASPYDILYQRIAGWGYSLQANKKLVFDITAKFSNGGNDIGQQYYEAELFIESWSYK